MYELSALIRERNVAEQVAADLRKTEGVSEITVETLGEQREGTVCVVKTAAWMAVCRYVGCKWKMRYNRKVEAERFAGMHEKQTHET